MRFVASGRCEGADDHDCRPVSPALLAMIALLSRPNQTGDPQA